MQGLAKQGSETLALDMLRSDPKQTEFVDFLCKRLKRRLQWEMA